MPATSSAGVNHVNKRPTWAEWQRMGWRARQRVRRAGGTPPEPPPMMQLLLSSTEIRQLDRLARQASVTRAEYSAMILGRHLKMKTQRKREATR